MKVVAAVMPSDWRPCSVAAAWAPSWAAAIATARAWWNRAACSPRNMTANRAGSRMIRSTVTEPRSRNRSGDLSGLGLDIGPDGGDGDGDDRDDGNRPEHMLSRHRSAFASQWW